MEQQNHSSQPDISNYKLLNMCELEGVPVMRKQDLEWLEFKWSSIGKIKMPYYEMSNFGANAATMEYLVTSKGFCVFTGAIGKGEHPTTATGAGIMIDTGAERTFITRKFVEKLKLDISKEQIDVNGHTSESSLHTLITVFISDLNMRLPMYACITSKECEGVDLFLGADFLKYITFQRNGAAGTFTLKM